MQIIKHRVNSGIDLRELDTNLGVEMDIRSCGDEIYVGHDAFTHNNQLFSDWLSEFRHGTLVVNVKEEGIEFRAREILSEKGVENYFLLDQSFPYLVKTLNLNESRCAVRFSDLESSQTITLLRDKVVTQPSWVWVDSFTGDWSHLRYLTEIRSQGMKTCIVSPELQGRPVENEIRQIRSIVLDNEIDAVCTKYPDSWKSVDSA